MGVFCQNQGSVFSAQHLFFSSFPDAPSRNPSALPSDGATAHESETTSHPPHATWHHAPNATTNGVTTTTHTGIPPLCTRTSENLSDYLGMEMRVGDLDFRNWGGKVGSFGTGQCGSVC